MLLRAVCSISVAAHEPWRLLVLRAPGGSSRIWFLPSVCCIFQRCVQCLVHTPHQTCGDTYSLTAASCTIDAALTARPWPAICDCNRHHNAAEFTPLCHSQHQSGTRHAPAPSLQAAYGHTHGSLDRDQICASQACQKREQACRLVRTVQLPPISQPVGIAVVGGRSTIISVGCHLRKTGPTNEDD